MKTLMLIKCLLLFLFFAQIAEAAPRKKKKSKKSRSAQTSQVYYQESDGTYVEETTTVYEPVVRRNSAYERKSKIMSLHVGGVMASAGVYLHPNFIIGAKWQKPVIVFGAGNIPTGGSHISAYSELFLGNSFYLTGGYGQRTLQYDGLTALDTILADSDKKDGRVREMTYTDLGFDVGFGNRWQWKYFSLGVQWLGAYIKTGDSEAELNFKGGANLADDIIREKNQRDDFTNPSLTSSLHIGVSF